MVIKGWQLQVSIKAINSAINNKPHTHGYLQQTVCLTVLEEEVHWEVPVGHHSTQRPWQLHCHWMDHSECWPAANVIHAPHVPGEHTSIWIDNWIEVDLGTKPWYNAYTCTLSTPWTQVWWLCIRYMCKLAQVMLYLLSRNLLKSKNAQYSPILCSIIPRLVPYPRGQNGTLWKETDKVVAVSEWRCSWICCQPPGQEEGIVQPTYLEYQYFGDCVCESVMSVMWHNWGCT